MDFLEVLRPRDLNDYFWADQISMNQDNINERNHQVGLMSRLFKDAMMVRAYLGGKHEQSFLIEQLRKDPHRILKDHQIGPLLDVFARPYWSRVWILQELFLATHVFLWVGEDEFYTEFLAHCWKNLRVYANQLLEEYSLDDCTRSVGITHQTLRAISKNRGALDLVFGQPCEYNPEQLLSVLYVSRQNMCRDPRDRIYGVQALVEARRRLPVDYALSFRQLSLRALQRIASDEDQEVQAVKQQGRPLDPVFNGLWRLDDHMRKCMELQLDLHDHQGECENIIQMMFWSARISCASVFSVHIDSLTPNRRKDYQEMQMITLWADVYRRAFTIRQKALATDLEHLIHLHVQPWRSFAQPAWQMERNIALETTPSWQTRRRDASETDLKSVLDSAMSKHGFVWYGNIIAHPDEWPLKDGEPSIWPSSQYVEWFYRAPLIPDPSSKGV